MYLKGDILIDFRRRILFEYPGPENFNPVGLGKCRLATPGETNIFRREFKGKKEVAFSAFKEVMPVFDGRKLHGIVYGHIPLHESEYKFFRSMKTRYTYTLSMTDKLNVLIENYLYPDKHNSEDTANMEKLKQFKSLLIDLLKDEAKK